MPGASRLRPLMRPEGRAPAPHFDSHLPSILWQGNVRQGNGTGRKQVGHSAACRVADPRSQIVILNESSTRNPQSISQGLLPPLQSFGAACTSAPTAPYSPAVHAPAYSSLDPPVRLVGGLALPCCDEMPSCVQAVQIASPPPLTLLRSFALVQTSQRSWKCLRPHCHQGVCES